MESLPAPFDRELLLFVGKGGVGKTTTASAVALRASRAGRRTLLVTVDPAQRLKDALGVAVGHRVRAVKGRLHAMMLDPERVIEEYVREAFPDRDLTRHPFYKYLSNYMPGINELLAIGKLIEFRRESDFETIVIDTAPTGHALSFLTTPLKVRDLLRENAMLRWAARGYTLYRRVAAGSRAVQKLWRDEEPLPPAPDVDLDELFARTSRRVGEIHDLLQDARRTTLTIVTLPERLPVQETVDLHRYITGELGMPVGALVVNKVSPDALDQVPTAFRRFLVDDDARRAVAAALEAQGYPGALLRVLVDATHFAEQRRDMNMGHLRDLEARLPRVPRFLVPLQREDVHGLTRLAEFEALLFDSVGRGARAARR